MKTLISIRNFASKANKRRILDKNLSLEYFLETAKSRQLWRFIVRSSYQLPSETQRKEIKDWARSDFERHRNETDPKKIKYLVSRGVKEVNDMVKYLQLPTQFDIALFDSNSES